MKKVLKKIISIKYWKKIKTFIYAIKLWKHDKVFCISMQRNGTTSVGKFLDDHGYRTQHYGRLSVKWTENWIKGDYEKIYRSLEFKSFNAYEDNPWWAPDFYRVLNNRFPKAKFILFYRDPDKWFDSMLRHPEIKYLINNYIHCKIYRKLDLFYSKIDNDDDFAPNVFNEKNHIPFEEMREHYKKVYREYNREVIEYFKKYAPDKFIALDLTDKEKWKKLGNFLKLNVSEDYDIQIKSPNSN